MRAMILLLLAIAALPCSAGQIYKCKGPKGEAIFTNIKCPESSTVQAVGSYQPAPDSPDQAREARAEARRIHERDNAPIVYGQPAGTSVAAGPTETGPDPAAQARNAKYREDLARWGKRMAGPPPPGYVDHASPQRVTAIVVEPTKPSVTQFCNGGAGNNMTCFGTDGSISNGHVDQSGNATMFPSTGGVQQMHVNGHGKNNCVSTDASGNCN